MIAAGQGTCALVAVGARVEAPEIRYPVAERALAHGAGVTDETTSPREANATVPGLSEAAERLPELYGRYRDGDLPA